MAAPIIKTPEAVLKIAGGIAFIIATFRTKKEYLSFDDYSTRASPEEMAAFFGTVGEISHDLGVEEQGYRLIANHRSFAGQEVEHFHVHILGGRPLGPMLMPQ